MSNSRKRRWGQRDRWNTVSYSEFRDSRQWRHLLALNPSYDIRYKPAPGVMIHTSGPIGSGKIVPSGSGTPGLLKNVDMNLELGRIGDAPYDRSRQASYFPWSTPDEYLDRAGDYTAQGVLSPDRTNGFSIDSPQAFSDTQRG